MSDFAVVFDFGLAFGFVLAFDFILAFDCLTVRLCDCATSRRSVRVVVENAATREKMCSW